MSLFPLAYYALLTGFGGMLLLLPFGILTTHRLHRRLRTAHRQVWEELGSPHLVMNNTPRNMLALRRWTRERRYEALNDPALAALVARDRVLGRVHIMLFALTLAAFAVVALGG